MKEYLFIGLGSAIGGMGRYWLASWLTQRLSESVFPWGTFAVNVSGSFCIGLLYFSIGPQKPLVLEPHLEKFILIGVLGGYTTFSTFSLQTLNLIRENNMSLAMSNILLSVFASLIAVWLGYQIAKLWN